MFQFMITQLLHSLVLVEANICHHNNNESIFVVDHLLVTDED
jgi:hypothetical protein